MCLYARRLAIIPNLWPNTLVTDCLNIMSMKGRSSFAHHVIPYFSGSERALSELVSLTLLLLQMIGWHLARDDPKRVLDNELFNICFHSLAYLFFFDLSLLSSLFNVQHCKFLTIEGYWRSNKWNMSC